MKDGDLINANNVILLFVLLGRTKYSSITATVEDIGSGPGGGRLLRSRKNNAMIGLKDDGNSGAPGAKRRLLKRAWEYPKAALKSSKSKKMFPKSETSAKLVAEDEDWKTYMLGYYYLYPNLSPCH
jgi:hypothetical protein